MLRPSQQEDAFSVCFHDVDAFRQSQTGSRRAERDRDLKAQLARALLSVIVHYETAG